MAPLCYTTHATTAVRLWGNQQQNLEFLPDRGKLSQPSLKFLNPAPTPVPPSGSQTSELLYSESWLCPHQKYFLSLGICSRLGYHIYSHSLGMSVSFTVFCCLTWFYVPITHPQIVLEASRALWVYRLSLPLSLPDDSNGRAQVTLGLRLRGWQMAASSNMVWGRMNQHI